MHTVCLQIMYFTRKRTPRATDILKTYNLPSTYIKTATKKFFFFLTQLILSNIHQFKNILKIQ